MTWDFVGIDAPFRVIVPAVGALLVWVVMSRKITSMNREATTLDRKLAELARAGTVPVLRRPTYRPRWRFPFRTLRSASLWVILVVIAPRSLARCTPDSQPALTVIDCALAAAVLTETVERLPDESDRCFVDPGHRFRGKEP